MARFIVFNGQTIVHPGAVSRINLQALAQVGVGATGVIGLIGEADSGPPGVAIFMDDPARAQDVFGSGPLADSIRSAFEPSNDPAIPGGAFRVVAVKPNQSTQGTATLTGQTALGTNGENQAVATSVDYGLDTSQVSLEFGADLLNANRFQAVIRKSPLREVITDIGGRSLLNIVAKGPEEEIIVYTGTTTAGGSAIVLSDTGILSATVLEDMYVRIVSSTEASIIGEYRRITSRINATSLTVSASEAASGFVAVVPIGTVYEVLKLRLATITITAVTNVAPNATVTLNNLANNPIVGLKEAVAEVGALAGLTLRVVSGNGQGQIRVIKTAALVGAAGTAVILTLADNDLFNIAPIVGDSVALVDLEQATATVTGTAGVATALTITLDKGLSGGAAGPVVDQTIVLSAIKKVSDIVTTINATLAVTGQPTAGSNYTASVGSGRNGALPSSRLDFDSGNLAVDLRADIALDPYDRTRFNDNLMQLIDAVNSHSSKLSLARSTTSVTAAKAGAGVPQFFTESAPLYLTGGTRGVSTNTNWQDAFDELLKHRMNTVVPLASEDLAGEGFGSTATIASIHAQLSEHVETAAGAGKSERNGYASIKATGVGALTAILAAAVALNTRRVSLTYQSPTVLDVAGNLAEMPPWGHAVIAAGMQAGSPIGEPLTNKYLRVSSVNDNSTAADSLDLTTSNQLLLGGILFSEFIKGAGHKWVRGLTTWLADDNLGNTDINVVEVLDYISYNLRTGLEREFTGKKAAGATVGSIKAFTAAFLETARKDTIIVDSTDEETGALVKAYRPPVVKVSGDIATVRVHVFPVVGINFITIEISAQLPIISA